MRILLVEDDALLALNLSEALEMAGNNVSVADTGAAALTMFCDGYPRAEVLIAEALLPDMGAWDVLAACRAVVSGLPAVIIDASPVQNFRFANYVVTLQKPFRDDALLAAIRAAVAGATS